MRRGINGPAAQSLLLICGRGRGGSHRDKLRRFQYGLSNRCRALRPERHQHACRSDGSQPDFNVALLHQVFHGGREDVAGERLEADRAYDGGTDIALLRMDGIHTLECELEIVTQPPVEDRQR